MRRRKRPARSRGHLNDRGTGLFAAPASPAPLANEKEKPNESQPLREEFPTRARGESVRDDSVPIGVGPMEDTDEESFAIEQEFGRRLAGLRRLPRRERAGALRAAREWRVLALKALKERKAGGRHARYLVWKAQLQTPRPAG